MYRRINGTNERANKRKDNVNGKKHNTFINRAKERFD